MKVIKFGITGNLKRRFNTYDNPNIYKQLEFNKPNKHLSTKTFLVSNSINNNNQFFKNYEYECKQICEKYGVRINVYGKPNKENEWFKFNDKNYDFALNELKIVFYKYLNMQ